MSKIDDVAKLASVSIATVSRVLNSKDNVSKKTKEKVLRAIEELDYKPSRIARNLANKKNSYNIGLVISKRIDKILKGNDSFGIREFYTTVLAGIETLAKENNIQIKMETFDNGNRKLLEDLDGLLIMGGDRLPNFIENSDLPKVLVDNYIPALKVDSVISNGFDGAYYTIKQMILRGYKKITHIHGPLTYWGFRNRFEGYTAAMTEFGLLPQTFECDETPEGILYALNLSLSKKPNVIFASNDFIALIILNFLKKKKIHVPKEIQLIGFDDIISSSVSEPKLSTVKVFKFEMGNIALNRLIDLINEKNPHPAMISLFTTFVERDSTIIAKNSDQAI